MKAKICRLSTLSIPLVILVILLCYLAACSNNRIMTFPTLANRGILALSTSNAYLGSNLFLAREVEKSSYLFKFFEGRGAPMAIEINEDTVSAPKLIMYYPRKREVYIADMTGDYRARQWVIRGPYQISREDFKTINRMQLALAGEPLFSIYGKPYRFRFNRQMVENRASSEVEPEIPLIPTPTPKPKRIYKKKATTDKEKTLKPKVPILNLQNPKDFKPLNTDQQAIAMSQGYAERTSSGDLIHTVKSDAETLTALSAWYTGSSANKEIIAELNKIEAEAALKQGDRIRFPLKMLKRFKVMP